MNDSPLPTRRLGAPDFAASDRFSAIEGLIELAVRRDYLSEDLGATASAEALRREKDVPTGIGMGLAIPHAFVPELEPVMVVATLQPPLDFAAPDAIPTWLLVLLLAPPATDDQNHHLKRLGWLAKMMGSQVTVERMKAARTEQELLESF